MPEHFTELDDREFVDAVRRCLHEWRSTRGDVDAERAARLRYEAALFDHGARLIRLAERWVRIDAERCNLASGDVPQCVTGESYPMGGKR